MMIFRLENPDNIRIFRKSSSVYKQIRAICTRFNEFPTIRVFYRPQDEGEDRGVYFQGVITLYWAELETPNSIVWVFLHEFKHHLMEKHYSLYREFFVGDEMLIEMLAHKPIRKLSIYKQERMAHEFKPTEVLCNAFATEMMGKDYGALWYKKRTTQIEKRNERCRK